MSFKELDLKIFYDNATTNIITDVVGPLLSHSKFYYRGVGYFSSTWISLLLENISEFCSNNGKMYIVTSVEISDSDAKYINIGNEAKSEEIIYNSIINTLNSLKTSDANYTLNKLAWLIADDILDIKFVLCDNSQGNYHDKLSVFIDEEGNMVSLHGSINDSRHATYNGESVTVFKSWVSGGQEYIDHHFNNLKSIYSGDVPYYKIYSISKAIKDEILKYRTSPRPYTCKPEVKSSLHLPEYITSLKDYQKEAINALRENNWTGLFNMATGTGKTVTALSSLVEYINEYGKTPLLVVVPSKYLLWQWSSIVSDFGFSNIVSCSSDFDWRSNLKKYVDNFKMGLKRYDNLVVITSNDTLSSDIFQKYIRRLGNKWFLVVDECHNIGAPEIRKSIETFSFENKLGLSATPTRWFDNNGTYFVSQFFDKTVFTYSLDDAIENNYLTPYMYNPIFYKLSNSEYKAYKKISSDIGKCYSIYGNSNDASIKEKIKFLSLKRKEIILNSKSKIEQFKKIALENIQNGSIKHSLVYCTKKNMDEIAMFLSKYNVKCCQFTAEESSDERKAIIESFEKGYIDVILSMKCLDEGVDIPCIKTAYFLANTSNPKEFIQRRGRILRKFGGKEYAIIYDFVVDAYGCNDFKIQEALVKTDYLRANEFIRSALNKIDSRHVVYNALKNINMEHYIDCLPSDVYQDE